MHATDMLEQNQLNSRDARGALAPARSETMQTFAHCAYNQTRECFLGLEVAIADLSYSALAEKMLSLELKSGEGLWITPFRGLPETGVTAPLDLIYLDDHGCAIDIVESFPTFQISPSKPAPASVLVLPAHSIYSSQTQAGDQLVLCMAEEMGACLDGLANGKSSFTVQSAVLLREQPLWSEGPGIVEFETPAPQARSSKEDLHEISLVKAEAKNFRAPKNWLERWWSPDPRKAPREKSPGLAAYYWNGAAPEAHGIRDISSSGLYLVTEERWYPGTLILMTLQRNDCGEQTAERSIQVLSRAVRWGHDGVGLQFMLADSKEAQIGGAPLMESADRKELEKFLKQLKRGK